MVNYALGKVYKLVNNLNTLIYIGITVSVLSRRRYYHTQSQMPGVKQLYDEIGWDKMKIVLVEEYPCDNNEQLRMRERHWYDLLKPSLNRARPFTSAEEKKALSREYYADPVIKERRKAFMAKYRADPINREKGEVRQTARYSNPDFKARRNEKVLCCCGCEINRSSKYTHRRSSKHLLLYAQVVIKERRKAMLAEKISCECGCEVSRGYIGGHLRTKKHHLLYAQTVADFIFS